MTYLGTRPILQDELRQYELHHRARIAIKPGIAAHYGLRTVNVLTGFKFIGEQIGKSDVLKFLLEDNCSLVVRPSGTEPKLKIYISVSAENKEMAEKVEDEIAKTAEKWIC